MPLSTLTTSSTSDLEQSQHPADYEDAKTSYQSTTIMSNRPDAAVIATQENASPEIDISAGQKMLSAVSGSLLTSLIGKKDPFLTTGSLETNLRSHTSRCGQGPAAITDRGFRIISTLVVVLTIRLIHDIPDIPKSRCHRVLSRSLLGQ